MNLRDESKEIAFIYFKPDNFLDGRVFFNQFTNKNLHPAIQFVLMSEEMDQLGFKHYKYQQTFAGTPIEGAEYRLTQGPRGLTFAGGFVYDIRTMPQVSLNASGAISKALSFIGANTYKWQIPEEELYIKEITNDPMASFYPKGEQVILPVETKDGISFKVSYKLDIYAHAPMSRNYVYVDAVDGKILSSISRIHTGNELGSGITLYNGTHNFHTDSYSGGYRLKEALPINSVTRSIYTKNMKKGTNYASAVEFQDADNSWTDNTNQDRAGWSAHWGAEATWDYYFYQLGRNSYDNAGATINSFVHYDNNYNNAFWDGTRMTYGDGDGSTFSPLVGLDVVGHEITHAVTERTSNLKYQNESGALNESFSDIFGTAIEFYKEGTAGDWMIGEDFDVQNHVGFRSMSNPKVHGDPDCYKGTNWKSTSVFPNLADDYGGVHSNSGVQNFWFYILSVGRSGTNDKGNVYSVTGIGLAKAAAIAYRNNATKLSQNSTFADARAGAIASAIELYGAGSPEEIATTNAWYAVGVGAAHTGGGGTPTCSVPTGLTSNTITASSANLIWGSVSSATGYNVRYKAVSSSTWLTTTATGTSTSVSGLSASTNYEFQVQTNCGGSNTSAYSASQTFTTSAAGGTPVSYCASKGNSTTDEWIAKVVIGNISNTSGNNSGYKDYTNLSLNTSLGAVISFTLTPGFNGGILGNTTYPEYWRIWIDYNKDGDFVDAGEMVYDAGSTFTTAKSGSFTIPATALTGVTRMRVQMKYNAAPSSCESFGYGEVEDYAVNIAAGGFMADNDQVASTTVLSTGPSFNIYPNPTSGLVYIDSDQNGVVRVMTLSGKIISEEVLDGTMTIQLNHMAKGIYLVELSNSTGKETKRIVLQ